MSNGKKVASQTMAGIAELFPEDDDSSADEQQHIFPARSVKNTDKDKSGESMPPRNGAAVRLVRANQGSQAPSALATGSTGITPGAIALVALFPSPPPNQDVNDTADGGRRRKTNGSAENTQNIVPPSSSSSTLSSSPERARISLSWRKRKRGKRIKVRVGDAQEVDAAQSSLHHVDMNGFDVPLGDKEANALEAAQEDVTSRDHISSEEADDFELHRARSPAEWMRASDTVGVAFIVYSVVLQLASICTAMAYLLSADEDQLSWKTGCWGRWTSLSDAEGVDFVEFETHIGWQLYGRNGQLGHLAEVSRATAVIGGLAGGMHTLVVCISCTFLVFSLSALWLSLRSPDGSGTGIGKGGTSTCCHAKGSASDAWGVVLVTPVKENALVLGRSCHRWMFTKAAFDILAGLWCFGLGCIGFYIVVTGDFSDGLEERVADWGENVSCAEAQTAPRYGFYTNAIAVVILLGGGITSLLKAYASDRDLNEAVDMWKRDRTETAEMKARLAMIQKKEDYAAAAALAAQRTIEIGRAFRLKEKPIPLPISPITSASVLPPSPASAVSQRPPDCAATTGVTSADADASIDLEIGFTAVGKSDKKATILPAARSRRHPTGIKFSLPRPRLISEGEDGAEKVAGDENHDVEVGPDQACIEGWDTRHTPSGEKFWVNLITKDVSWERPS